MANPDRKTFTQEEVAAMLVDGNFDLKYWERIEDGSAVIYRRRSEQTQASGFLTGAEREAYLLAHVSNLQVL